MLLRFQRGIANRSRKFLAKLARLVRPTAVRSQALSAFYFLVFDRSFWREQRAALAGQMVFERYSNRPVASSSLLRRSIHRIEKGLISKPRRVPFALDYIEATVGLVEACSARPGSLESSELAWAFDVLTRYFDAHADYSPISGLERRFRSIVRSPDEVPPPNRALSRAPYHRDVASCQVSFDDFLRLCEQRRSVRWFQDRSVPRSLLIRAMEAARLSPSACNRQPFRFLVFDRGPLKDAVASLPPGVAGFEHNFPAVIAIVGRLRYYSELRDRHLIYIDGSLAAMSFLLALETLGLSSCCINWPDIEEIERRAEAVMKLEPDERPVMFLAVGYPDSTGQVPYSEKVPAADLLVFDDRG